MERRGNDTEPDHEQKVNVVQNGSKRSKHGLYIAGADDDDGNIDEEEGDVGCNADGDILVLLIHCFQSDAILHQLKWSSMRLVISGRIKTNYLSASI